MDDTGRGFSCARSAAATRPPSVFVAQSLLEPHRNLADQTAPDPALSATTRADRLTLKSKTGSGR